MPYRDREQQLAYMRIYMQRKRALDRIERLKQRKKGLVKEYEDSPWLMGEMARKDVASYIREQIKKCQETVDRCEGLLANGQKHARLT